MVTETVSEGKAKLAYQPRDKKFLNLKKGDVVLVKGKKAGLKTDLWGGQVRSTWFYLYFVKKCQYCKNSKVVLLVTNHIMTFLSSRNC